ncbi:MAG TPA: penicillin-binding transpeptidase domain-containing protein [Acidobacteriaceae bacterium]|nr:penicillin-binding transpeptidase domain-containing protein [Acidobacteriaceae bacterium]
MRRILYFVLLGLLVLPASLFATDTASKATTTTTTHHRVHRRAHVRETAAARRRIHHLQHARRVVYRRHVSHTGTAHVRRVRYRIRRRRYYQHWDASSFVSDPSVLTQGDVTGGEDPIVRQAAIDALGNMNGTVVAIDPNNGRILAMVNQKLALSSGAEPCSTIKISVALAALEEGIVTKDTLVDLGGSYRINMTTALAHSVNAYFEVLGRELGFERVKHYANEFGLGELAGYDIPGEHLGVYPDEPLPADRGGVGRMCSFGESVSMTPLQLGALVSAVANGGTLYYLQHPTTPEQVLDFKPRIKRLLNIKPILPEVEAGMLGAVDYGTARSLRTSFRQIPVLGKTGTCSDDGTRFGWFASFADTQYGKIVVVFFLEGGAETYGPKAADLAGHFYRDLWDDQYFAAKQPTELGATTTAVGASQ